MLKKMHQNKILIPFFDLYIVNLVHKFKLRVWRQYLPILTLTKLELSYSFLGKLLKA